MSEQKQDQGRDVAPELAALEAEAESIEGDYIGGDSGQDQEPEGPAFTTADILEPLLRISFGLVATRKGKHWELSGPESKEAAQAYGAVIDHYFPDVTGGPVVSALLVTGAILGPRVAQDKAIQARAKQEAAKRERKAEQGNGVERGADDAPAGHEPAE